MTEDKKPILPKHVGLITDGNRRWAREHGLPSLEGHRRGFEAVKKIAQAAKEGGIEMFTFWCFSTENWDRSKEEIAYLMDLFELSLEDYKKSFGGQNVRIRIIGQKWRLRQSIQDRIKVVERETAGNTGMTVNLALSYGGRDELVEAFRSIQKQGIAGDKITEQTISDNIWTPNVDLIIRTGGEMRLSGFMTWQSQYAELVFVKKYLPDFGPDDFDAALAEFANRQRRFGK